MIYKARRYKGVRAITHAAFTIGFMKYCKNNNLPHTNLVIMDSPLTTLREGQNSKESEEVSGEVQRAFFESLSLTSTDEQIIILENKEPPANTRTRINLIEFTGKGGGGREGFFPA